MAYSFTAVRDQEAVAPLPLSLRSLMLDETRLRERELAAEDKEASCGSAVMRAHRPERRSLSLPSAIVRVVMNCSV